MYIGCLSTRPSQHGENWGQLCSEQRLGSRSHASTGHSREEVFRLSHCFLRLFAHVYRSPGGTNGYFAREGGRAVTVVQWRVAELPSLAQPLDRCLYSHLLP